MKPRITLSILAVAALSLARSTLAAGFDGRTSHDEVLLGLHYGDMSNHEGRNDKDHPVNIWPYFEDYLKYMEGDVLKTSYANFWRWWYILERYKGDEKGMDYLDGLVDQLLDRGIKTKIDLCWSTWWDLDMDWEKGAKLSVSSQDQDEWIHLCDRLARRYRGRIAHWDLQGEANDLKGYWMGKPISFVQENYKLGYRAFKRVDPEIRIGISGASPSVSRERMDEWYSTNIAVCAGFYDSIPLNYFADIKGADPYEGGVNFHNAVRAMLDGVGQKHTEIGMGEASVQWAETTETAGLPNPPLSMQKQAERLNQTLGGLSALGMNKYILWGTEFAPGGGHWAWRWGLRNYEDWWGIWPESFKVPGTQIVYRYDSPKGRMIDLRPNWPRPTDPYYPAWEVFCFWAQAAPPSSQAIRVPSEVDADSAEIFHLATYQRANNRAVALAWRSKPGQGKVRLKMQPTGWRAGSLVSVRCMTEQISLSTGEHDKKSERTLQARLDANQALLLDLGSCEAFTSAVIEPLDPEQQINIVHAVAPAQAEIGESIKGHVVIKNAGDEALRARNLTLRLLDHSDALDKPGRVIVGRPRDTIAPGQTALIPYELPAQASAGRGSANLRLYDSKLGWLGPMFTINSKVVDSECPRKLVAHREVGHIRLKWFPPMKVVAGTTYEIQRAPGFDQPFTRCKTSAELDYIDTEVQPDKAYYYRVIAINGQKRSRPSNEDNARALSQPRIYDAEIVSHSVPAEVRIGEPVKVAVTLKNTGSKTWDMSRPEELRYWLQAAQLWGRQDDEHLPQLSLGEMKEVKPGETVTLSFLYVGSRPGRFENHWVVRMAVPSKERTTGWDEKVRQAWFGTPLLVETTVTPK